MPGGVEHDSKPGPVAPFRLRDGFGRATDNRPRNTGSDILNPDVQVHLHPLIAASSWPHRTLEVLLELDLDLRASVRGTEPRPPVTRWTARSRPFKLLHVPAKKPLVETRQLVNVRRVEYRSPDAPY